MNRVVQSLYIQSTGTRSIFVAEKQGKSSLTICEKLPLYKFFNWGIDLLISSTYKETQVVFLCANLQPGLFENLICSVKEATINSQ